MGYRQQGTGEVRGYPKPGLVRSGQSEVGRRREGRDRRRGVAAQAHGALSRQTRVARYLGHLVRPVQGSLVPFA